MKIRTFIDRPILAGVISVVFLIIGLIGLSQLPVEQFPEIAPPTVSVSATYTGANAETVQKILDVVKKTAYGVDFVLWGLENQAKIHYAMPLRHMAGVCFCLLYLPRSICKIPHIKARSDKLLFA